MEKFFLLVRGPMSIRNKIFLILGVSQLILVLFLTVSSVYLILNIKNEPQNKRALEGIALFQRELLQKQEKMELVLKNILKNPEAVKILNNGFESKKYLIQNEYFFKNLMKSFHLDILELGDMNGKVYYRFHNPEKFGDDKTFQKIIQKAIKGQQSTALEVGNSGLALRTVVPFNGVGTLMLGQLVNNEFLSELSFHESFLLAILQDDLLIAASSPIVEKFLKENPVHKISGRIKKFQEKYFYAVSIPYDDKGYSSIQLNFLVLIDETELQSMIRNAWFTLASISIAMLLFIFLVSFLFSKDILESLKILADSMKNFKLKDDLTLQGLISTRKDEIADMANVFLSLKTDLRTYQNHLEELVRIKTDELTRSNQKLDKLLEELQNKQLQIEHEFVVAQSLQSHLVPDPDKLIAPLQVHCIYQPASGVSGDIYDFGMLGEDGCYFFLADVSGHGIPAAMVTAMVKISLGKIPLDELDPKDALIHLNQEMVELLDDHYFTAFLCKIDFRRKTLIYANAGGTPGILLKTLRNSVQLLKPTGSVMGVFEDLEIFTQTVRIEAGDKLFLFTDGITEQKNPQKKLFGLRATLRHLKEYRFNSNHEILETLLRKLVKHANTTQFDDDVSCILANLG